MRFKKLYLSQALIFLLLLSSFAITMIHVKPASLKEGQEESKYELIGPKSSEGTITEKWRYGFPNSLYRAEISEKGNFIFTANVSGTNLFYKSSNATIWRFTGANGDITISDDGTYVAQTGSQNFLLNNTPESPKTEMWKYPTGNNGMEEVALSSDGYYIAAGDEFGVVYLFNKTCSGDKLPMWKCEVGFSDIGDIAISEDGSKIVAGDWDGKIYFLNSSLNGPKIPEWEFDTTDEINDVAISDDGEYVVIGNIDNEVYFFNTSDYQGEPMWNYTRGTTTDTTFVDIDISGDGNYVVIAYDDMPGDPKGTVCLLNKIYSKNKIPMWSRRHSLNLMDPNEDIFIRSIDFSDEGNYFVAGYRHDGPPQSISSVLLFDREGLIWEGLNYSGPFYVESVSISEKGNYFAVAETGGGRENLHLFFHDIPTPPGLIPGAADDDDDDDDEIDLTLPIILTIVFVCIGGGIVVIYVLMRKGIIDFSKLKGRS